MEAPSGQLKEESVIVLKRDQHLQEDNLVHLGGASTNTRASELEVEDGVTAVGKSFGASLKTRRLLRFL